MTKDKKEDIDIELSDSLQQNIDLIQFFMGKSSDFIMRELYLPNKQRCILYYLDGMVNRQALQDHVVSPLLERVLENGISAKSIKERILNASEVSIVHAVAIAMDKIIAGAALLLIDGSSEGVIIPLPGWEDRSITESQTQSAVRGPQNSFTESICTNRTLVRRIAKDTRVRVTTIKVGKLTKTDVSIMHIQGLADEKLVNQLVDRLQHLSTDRILEGQYIEELLTQKKQWTFFPTFYNSDRPDSIAAGILDGKIAIFVDGTPFVLLIPAFFTDFIHSVEDHYQSYGSTEKAIIVESKLIDYIKWYKFILVQRRNYVIIISAVAT